MGQIIKARSIPTLVPRRHRAQRGHALHHRLVRSRQGAVGAQPARHEGTATSCSRCSTAGRTCSRCPGKRTTGTGAQTYAITGPGWTGTLPAGVKEYKSPTDMVWLLGPHLLHRHAGGLRGRHALQDQFGSCRSAPMASPTRRRRARSTRRST